MQVSFIIPVFNQLAHTKACVDSLRAHVPPSIEHEIILVDDGSDPATRNFLRSLSSPFRTSFNESNQGFAVSTNRGARLASGHWLCLLNNDVELTSGALAAMLAVPQSHRDAGIVGNIQLNSKTRDIDHAGIDFVDGGYPRHRRGDLTKLQSAGDAIRVPAVTAACCLVHRHWFVTNGGLDERYQNGFEDVDLCLRAREAGWQIYVAAQSVVRHAVSASEGRGSREFRNARQFLERWGPRTAAIECEERQLAARAFREYRARAVPMAALPASVRTVRQATLDQAVTRIRRLQQPAIVWVDLMRLSPGGANGGIKPYIYAFLRGMGALTWPTLKFVVMARENLAAELSFLRDQDVIVSQRTNEWILRSAAAAPTSLSFSAIEKTYPPEVLYCPFGTSSFTRPGLPMVALIVDLLHRDLPAALPIEEVTFREDSLKRVIGSAVWLQSLSEHGSQRLVQHYGVHPTRCFHTYIPAHDRFDSVTPPPAKSSAPPFFLYPANFWPHKNHEVLLTAYRLYRHHYPKNAWPLVLTGHPDERMARLQALAVSLGLADSVHFRGHLDNDEYATLWRDAGAMVFPSLHEGFGMPLLEAFHHGVPVLASNASALPEVGREACLWFDPAAPRALAQSLAQVAGNADLREELIAAGTANLARFSLHYEASRLAHFLHAAARHLVP